jgi:hypothetical protein
LAFEAERLRLLAMGMSIGLYSNRYARLALVGLVLRQTVHGTTCDSPKAIL